MFFDNVSYFFQAPNKQIQENHAEFSHCFFSWRRKSTPKAGMMDDLLADFHWQAGWFVFCHQTFQVPKMEESSAI